MNNTDYIYDDIVDAIKRVGVMKNDVLFSHSNIGFFGKLYDAKTTNDYCHAFMKAIFEIIGIKLLKIIQKPIIKPIIPINE